jgi:nucleoid-associated protein YgaU
VLDLPVSDTDSGRDRDNRRAGTHLANDGADDDSEIRMAARPRASAPTSRPVYKVRPYDTLRSIARDTLGDARRAGEILELNRNLIEDPTHLIPGQLIELPDDADTRRVTITSW